MKANGAFTLAHIDKHAGTWKVASQAEGKYKLHVVDDAAPAHTRGWVITPKGDDAIVITGWLWDMDDWTMKRIN